MYKSLKNALFKSDKKSRQKCERTSNNWSIELDIRSVIESEEERWQCGGSSQFANAKVSHKEVRPLVNDHHHHHHDIRHLQISVEKENRPSTDANAAAVAAAAAIPGTTSKVEESPSIRKMAASASADSDSSPKPTIPKDGKPDSEPEQRFASSSTTSTPSSSSFESVADFLQHFANLRTEVRIMMANQSTIYLLGTNHADPQCPVDVANVIGAVKPQLVIIELCAWRACGCDIHRGNVFQTKPEFTFRYLRKVISQIGFLPAMIFFTDAFNEQHTVTDSGSSHSNNSSSSQLLDYGGEFAVAARLCEQIGNCRILLGDREIPITVKRQASGMGNWRGLRISLLVTLALIFKRRMRTLLLRGHRLVVRDPRFYQIVVLERDIFLTYMLQVAAAMKYDAQQPQIVAVVGQGHLNGIQRFWGRILPQILPVILKPDLDF